MLTLLNPSALLALLGLLVPVAIHLWNRRPGREVAVGSLRWLAAGANRRLRNLKLDQLWLLVLRASLLAMLAGVAAGPVWHREQPASLGQILVSPELQGAPALATLQPTLDSLRRRGYTLRWLAVGFPKIAGATWRTDSLGQPDSVLARFAASQMAADAFRWARVQEAAGAFPAQPLYIVTPATLRRFQGTHAPIKPNITWQTLPLAGANSWLQAAALRGDSLRLWVGQSSERQTHFRLLTVARPRPGGTVRVAELPPLRFELANKQEQLLALNASNAVDQTVAPVPVRTRPLRVVVYATPDYAPDSRYLLAGLRAAAAGLPEPLALSATASRPNPTAPPDWLFWLTDAPLPAAWQVAVARGTTIWQEARGPGVPESSRVAPAAAEALVTVFRRGSLPRGGTPAGVPIWTDGLGQPVLSRRPRGQGAFYQLHTRLNPAWSELADSPALPARLLELLRPGLVNDDFSADEASGRVLAAHDRRALDPSQLLRYQPSAPPGHHPPALSPPPAPSAARLVDLRPWLVLVAGLLFAFERLLAQRRDARALPSVP
ncbi:MAG: hypothetical protein NVS3B25_29030 [Hymenobacter sp.]